MLSEPVKARLAELHPEGAAALERVVRQAQAFADTALLALCAGYIDSALRDEVWTPPHALSAREQAFVAFTEQFVASVGTISDEQVSALLEFASEDDIYNFAHSLYAIDMARRVDRVAGSVLL